MNKIKRIAILFLIISTIFNFIYSVKASGASVGTNNIINIKKTKAEIIELKQKVDNLKKNKEKSQEVMAKYPSYFQNEMLRILDN